MRHERPLLYAILLTLLALITLPYLYAWHLTPPNHVYTGLLWLPDDQNVHLTWAKQASEGHFLLPNLYSSDTLHTPPTFSNLVLYAIGTTARLTHLPLILTYHAYRLLFAALTILFFHKLTTLLTDNTHTRLTATFLVAFSAGFGYLAWFCSPDPTHAHLMDLPRGILFVPEAYTFTSSLIYPLNAASLFLLCATFYYLLLSHRTRKLRHALYAGLAALVLGNSHTYDSLPLLTTLGVYFLLTLFRPHRHSERSEESHSPDYESPPLAAPHPTRLASSRISPSPGTPGEGRGEGSAPRPSTSDNAPESARDAGVSPPSSLPASPPPHLPIAAPSSPSSTLHPPSSSSPSYSSFILHPSSLTFLTLALATIPVAIQAALYFFNPEFRYSKTHYPVTPLPILPTLLSFGPLVPLAAYGVYLTRRHRPSLLMTLWAATCLLLMYAPFLDFGRKLIEGLQLPLAYLAATAAIHLISRLHVSTSSRLRSILHPPSSILALFLLSCTLSLPLILTQILHHRTDPSWPTPRTPLDLPSDYAAALDFLDHLPPADKANAVVLAMPPLSNHLPPRTGLHTYVGHWAESIRFVSKFWTARNFFTGTMSPADTAEFLSKNHLTLLLQSPPTDPPTTTPPSTRLSLPPPLFQSHDTAVYRLPPAGAEAPMTKSQ